METIKKSVKCDLCKNLVVQPVILPCGHSLCKRHEEEIRSNTERGICMTCYEPFSVPTSGLTPIKSLENLLEKKIHLIDLGKDYKKAETRFQSFRELCKELYQKHTSANDIIHDTIDKIRQRIEKSKRDYHIKVEEEAALLLDLVNDYEQECRANTNQLIPELARKMLPYARLIVRWKKELGSFEGGNEKFKELAKEITHEMRKVFLESARYDRRLFQECIHEYTNLDLVIQRNVDLHSTNTIRVEVPNVWSLVYSDQPAKAISNDTSCLGVEWTVMVHIPKHSTPNTTRNVSVRIKGIHSLETHSMDVSFDVSILSHQGNSDRDFTKHYTSSFNRFKKYAVCNLIQFSDVYKNRDLYNSDTDGFTVQVLFHEMKWRELNDTDDNDNQE